MTMSRLIVGVMATLIVAQECELYQSSRQPQPLATTSTQFVCIVYKCDQHVLGHADNLQHHPGGPLG